MIKQRIKKEIKFPLKHSWESIEMIRAQYEEGFSDYRLERFKEFYDGMDAYERDILVLYSEYASFRKVADETYCTHQTIRLILSVIRKDIFEFMNNG